MTALASHLATFLREHLPRERRASPHTCEAYAHSFRILVGFAAHGLRIRPYQLEVEQLDVPLILKIRHVVRWMRIFRAVCNSASRTVRCLKHR